MAKIVTEKMPSAPKVWHVGDVECREIRYPSGLVEIGFHTPGVIASASSILRTVADYHGPESGWFAHTSGTGARGIKCRSRKMAIALCVDDAQETHGKQVEMLRQISAGVPVRAALGSVL